jgi:hypothetical protein
MNEFHRNITIEDLEKEIEVVCSHLIWDTEGKADLKLLFEFIKLSPQGS